MAGNESIKYSLRNLKKSKSRSFLTILSIFAGIATIFIFISFGLGLYAYIDDLASGSSADKILIYPGGGNSIESSFELTDDDLRVIENTRGVIEASGSYFEAAKVEKDDEVRYTFLVAYDPAEPIMLDTFDVDIEKGRLLKPGDDGKVLLGYNFLLDDNIFSKAMKINDKIKINDEEFRVVGFFEEIGSPTDDSQIYMTTDYYEDVFGENTYGVIVARGDKDDMDDTVERIREALRRSRNVDRGEEDFTAQSFNE